MPIVTRKVTRKSSRLGSRNYKSPPPLRFKSVKDAREHIKKNKLKVKEHHRSSRGIVIQVVDQKGKARTLSVLRRKTEDANGD